MVQGIDNIGICTTDLTQSVTFYEMLGFSEAYRNDRGVTMTAGTAQLFFFQVRRSDLAPYVRLCEADVVFAGPPEDQSWGARIVGVTDPDGNNLYLLQRLRV
jgi:catechol 2,3-dioxygenase-like lactoylglutathione lyase family enzyme